MLGVGATSKLLTGGIGIGLAAEAIEEVATLPQHFAAMERSALGGAKPYWDYRQQMAGLAHAGGMDSEDLQHQFYQGVNPPDWMKNLGLGPQQAAGLLRGYGILQTGEGAEAGNRSVVQELAQMKFIPAFGGLPEGMVENSASNAAKYGAVGSRAGGLREYDAQMVDVLARGTELGLNRSSIMRSIDSSIATAARAGGGVGFTPESVGSAMLQYASLPGGRTGEVGQSMIAAGQNFAQQTGTAPIPTIAFASLAQRLTSEGDVKSYFDSKEAGFYDKIKSNPASAKLLQDYLDARKDGNMVYAAKFLSEIAAQSPDLPVEIAGTEGAMPSLSGGKGYMNDANRAAVLNQPIMSTIGRDQARAAAQAGSTVGKTFTATQKSAIEIARASYRNAGYSSAQTAGILGTDLAESGLNPRAFNADGGGQGAMGIGQWRGSRITDFEKIYHHSPIDPNIPDSQLLREQLEFQQTELSTGSEAAHGRMLRATTSVSGAASVMVNNVQRPGADAFAETGKAIAYANRVNTEPDTGGMYDGQLAAQSAGLAGIMSGSQVTAAEVTTMIPKLNASIQAMIDGLGRAQAILSSQSVEQTTAQLGALN